MVIRISLRGGGELSGVAASVVERLARDTGFAEDEARGLADTARDACATALEGSSGSEVSVEARGARVTVSVAPGAAGEARMTAEVARRAPS